MKWLSIIRNKKAFTLIEMMIVLMIISILLLIAVPSMTKSNKVVKAKSCEATIRLVQSQVAAYNLNNKDSPLSADLQPLVDDNYVDSISCPDGGVLQLGTDGKVTKDGSTT